jgi:hypothetical protein
MKRKPAPEPDPVVPKQIIESAKRAAGAEAAPRVQKCVVCSDPCAPNSTEGLCWVCRRLKISAWRDSDSQMSAQE